MALHSLATPEKPARSITLDINKIDLALHKAKALLSVTASAVLCDDPPTEQEVYNACWIAIDILEEAERATKGEVAS